MRPFLKWAGGKYRLVEQIKEVLPPGKRLVEPFVGSGAVFLNTDYPHYLLSDVNKDLIALYQTLQAGGAAFVDYCETFFVPENNEKEKFYEYRALFNTTTDVALKSALFLYLNRHGFNGLCRYNSKGEFNVPFGRYKKPYFPRQEMLFFNEKAERASFIVRNFETVMDSLFAGDVVYCDPPYVPISDTANFTSYSAGRFGREEQIKLARLAEKLAQNCIPVVISNHDTSFTKHQYQKATIKTFQVQRHISRDGENRQKANELLAVFGGAN